MATRTIGTEIVLTGEKAFNDAMKGVNSNLKNLRTDMARVSAEFDGNADSIEALTAKQKVLEQSVDQHREKVDALTRMYERSKQVNGENSAATDKYRQQLNQAAVALAKEENALKRTSSAIDEQKAAMTAAAQAAKQQVATYDAYTPATRKMLSALQQVSGEIKKYRDQLIDAAKNTPVLAEMIDIISLGMKGLGTVATGTGKILGGISKSVGAVAAASAAGVAAIGAGGVIALTTMANMAKEAAEAAKAAHEAGESLTETQQQWLAYSNQLDALDASVAGAKGALAGVLLPLLGDLSTEGSAFLNDFTRDMTAAAGDTGKQTKVLSDYIVKGATLIKEKLPEYIAAGKELFAGIGEGLSENGDELLGMGLDLTMDLLDGIIQHAPELAQAGISLIQKLIEGLIERGPDVLASGVQMVIQIISGLAEAAPTLIPMATQLVIELLTALVQNAPLLLEAGLELVLGLISGILNALGDIGSAADELIDAFVAQLMSSDSKILQFGGKVVDWIRDGIAAAWEGLVSWFDGIWDKLFGNRNVDVNVNGNDNTEPTPGAASGLDYVPYDNYLIRLHKGEKVLTAAEAALYRAGQTGQTVKQCNITIHTQSLAKEELDMIVSYVNGKLGDDL